MTDALHRAGSGGVDPNRLVQLAARAIPHASHCAITMLRVDRRPHTLAASDALPVAVDDLQYDLGEGPCLDAACGKDSLVLANDLASDQRWSRFSTLCVERTGVHAMLSVRLDVADKNRAALNFYSSEPGAFKEADQSVASLLAPLAASAAQADLYRQQVTHLETALTTSRQIGAAIGILMSQRGLSYEQAFDELRRASQHLNIKLRDVAEQVRDTGKLPDDDARHSSTWSGDESTNR